MDYVFEIAKKINSGANIALYSLGVNTALVLNELKAKFNVLPAVICDKDALKHGKKYKGFYGLDIMPIEAALKNFDKLEVFITSLNYRHQIIGELTENSIISKEHIINFVPVEKRKGCNLLENRALYFDGWLQFCVCEDTAPKILKYTNEKAKEFMELQEFHSKAIAVDSKNTSCYDCGTIKEDYYPVDRQLTSFNYCNPHICNFRCVYCFSVGLDVNRPKKDADIELGELMKPYLDNGWLDENYELILSTAGEPTIHPKRADYYNAFNGYVMVVNTNGSVFDEDLFALMNEKKVYVQISIDSGTKETFISVKGVDCFERVVKNISMYNEAKIGMVMLKYIFIPGLNDSDEDLRGFLEIVDKTDVSFVNLAIVFASHRVGHGSILDVTSKSIDQMRNLKAEIEKRNKLCFLNTANETYDTVEILENQVGRQ